MNSRSIEGVGDGDGVGNGLGDGPGEGAAEGLAEGCADVTATLLVWASEFEPVASPKNNNAAPHLAPAIAIELDFIVFIRRDAA
jgi:hypothetical protein